MASEIKGVITPEERTKLREQLLAGEDCAFLTALPKADLHVHIEGTLTAELRWKISQRSGRPLKNPRTGEAYVDLDHLKAEEAKLDFFELYYGGFDVLQTREDFCDLAMNYFAKAATMNARYCEPFFDPQGHTRRGVAWETFMGGFKDAQIKAEKELNVSFSPCPRTSRRNEGFFLVRERKKAALMADGWLLKQVKSNWVMCFLRDMSPESAMEHYEASLAYRDTIVGVGLDSNSYQRPPMLFEDVWTRARADGFLLTSHCDFEQHDVLEHIRQTASVIGGGRGADRIDHGLNAADSPELVATIKQRDLGMTICPWAYMRGKPADSIFPRIRQLFAEGIKIMIGSDDPAYLDDCWVLQNLLLVKNKCAFSDQDMVVLVRNAISICWASPETKAAILSELDEVVRKYSK